MFGRGIGAPELILLFVVVLIIFGAGRLPEVGRGIGTAIKEFRGSIGNIGGNKANAETAEDEKADPDPEKKSD